MSAALAAIHIYFSQKNSPTEMEQCFKRDCPNLEDTRISELIVVSGSDHWTASILTLGTTV